MTEFGRVIRRGRMRRDMLMGYMANACALPPAYLSGIETGRYPLTDEVAAEIFKFCEQHDNRLRGVDYGAIDAECERKAQQFDQLRQELRRQNPDD